MVVVSVDLNADVNIVNEEILNEFALPYEDELIGGTSDADIIIITPTSKYANPMNVSDQVSSSNMSETETSTLVEYSPNCENMLENLETSVAESRTVDTVFCNSTMIKKPTKSETSAIHPSTAFAGRILYKSSLLVHQ